METAAHQLLKRLALAFLREAGVLAVGCEVRCPISRYRVDVAGYADSIVPDHPLARRAAFTSQSDRHAIHRRRCVPATIIIECKQSREDFLRHSEVAADLIEHRQQLDRLRQSMEWDSLRRHEPHLQRRQTSLFDELNEWDFSASRSPGYRAMLRRLRRLDQQLHGDTKFFLIARYALADRLFIAAPRGMVRRNELPDGWGLLECPERLLTMRSGSMPAGELCEGKLELVIDGPCHSTRESRRARLLRNIAIAASFAAYGRQTAESKRASQVD